jgi:hypothetical protein
MDLLCDPGFHHPRDPDTHVLQGRSTDPWKTQLLLAISKDQIDSVQSGECHAAEDSIAIDQVVPEYDS